MIVYCGNNYFEKGNRPLGTPYECMKKGIGAGLRGDLSNFSPNYRPIFPNDKFCGIGKTPANMVRGKPHECLSKGYGIGLKLQYDRRRSEPVTDLQRVFICAIIVLVLVQIIFREWILTFIIFVFISAVVYWLN